MAAPWGASAPEPPLIPDASTSPALRVQDLVKVYEGGVRAVDGLSLEVSRGECFGLLGPNGAGKTTTIEILEGLLEPTAGHVEVLGRSWRHDARAMRERLGITLQETRLPDRQTVAEALALFRSFYGRGRDIDEVLSWVSLGEKRDARYHALSGGQKQRLAVACALVSDPELICLDEPTTGLDPQSRRQLWEVVERARSEGRTILLTTHYMDEAQRLCDRVAVIDHGKVIALGTPRELIRELVGEEVVEFSVNGGDIDDASLRALDGVSAVRRVVGHTALTVSRIHVAVPALLALVEARGLALDHLSTHSATLEDVFITLTGRHLRD